MTPDTIDWDTIASLPTITVEAGDLDVAELVQIGLVAPTLRLTHTALAALADVDALVVRDVEATPLLRGSRRGDLVDLEPLRRVAPVSDVPGLLDDEAPVDLAVVVREVPSAADLARVDALTTPRSRVLWIVLAGRTRDGREILASIPEVIAERPRGHHQVVRVPWPAPGSRGVFERPQLPDAGAVAAARGAKHFVVVGAAHPETRRVDRGGTVVFFTGLSGSGKSTIAKALRDSLEQQTDREITLLDGDDVRRMLSAGLGFDDEGRAANVRRVSWVAALLARHGGIAITALIAPFAEGRAEARRMAEEAGDFLEVWVSTSIDECERRDRKGLYAQARAGRIPNFTGIDSPYEEPVDADLVIDTAEVGISEAVEIVVRELAERAVRRGTELGPVDGAPSHATQEELVTYDI
ncbi:MAG: adenylyl-sulfate kinase [Propionicimonas sp.]|uniref:adenylyl-sulfate kinase n=1 Tax=Propionicimonas sp. TaxID=1955623 RepID=UPI003D0A5FF2